MKLSRLPLSLCVLTSLLAGPWPSVAAESPAPAPAITSITPDAMRERFTARDLLGAPVYDSVGHKLGAIVDLDLPRGAPRPAALLQPVGGSSGDLVRIPLTRLRYDRAVARFEISLRRAEVAAFTGSSPAAPGRSSARSPTAAARYSFRDGVRQVRDELADNPQTAPLLARISVHTDGEAVELQGLLDNREQHQQVLAVVRRTTTLEVHDRIYVRSFR